MIDRRTFNLGVAGAVAAAATTFNPLNPSAMAQTAAVDRWQKYSKIVEDARALGLAPPRATGLRSIGTDDAITVFSDLVEALERSAESESKKAEAEPLIERAAELLRETTAGDAAPSEARFGAQRLRSAAPFTRPVLNDELKAEYEELFRTATVRPNYRSKVAWYVNKLKDPDNQARYKAVAEQVCVPWFAVGIIHGMEAGFNFRGHLHNGDSLKQKTRNVPSGRPRVWNPPNSWEVSAVDALQFDKLDNNADWSLAATLFRWEGYNGFRSRVLQKINTPYLWSFSNHYSKGKYVSDGVWNRNAVSAQCGAAVMLKVLVDEGIVTVPSA